MPSWHDLCVIFTKFRKWWLLKHTWHHALHSTVSGNLGTRWWELGNLGIYWWDLGNLSTRWWDLGNVWMFRRPARWASLTHRTVGPPV